MAKSSTAIYLYCVVKSARRPSVARVPDGLPEATRPEAHQARASLWVVAAEVPLAVYGPAALEPRLWDLDWVSRAAVAHEAVVEHFARVRAASVVPAKLFTMFSSLDKAIADVAARRAAIDRVMKRIAGCQEWGVRVTRKSAAAVPAPAGGPPASGTAFLAARKSARDAAANARVTAATAAAEAFRRLARYARDASQRERRQEPGPNPPILEAAFLVPIAARARFQAEARRQAAACVSAGADMTLSGPWPAYNFAGNAS